MTTGENNMATALLVLWSIVMFMLGSICGVGYVVALGGN